jgi:membrane-bound serine protease (ClpP class)
MVPSMKLSPHYAVAPLNTLSLEPLPAGRFVDVFTARTLAWLLLLICPGSLLAQQKVEGEWFVIPGEITTETYRVIRNDTERAIKKGVQKIVYEFQSRELSEFGPCNDLATFFLQEIKGTVQTIAVVDGPINGNAVLPVLSCNSVYMTPQASIGFNQRALEKSGIIDVTKVVGFMKVGENRGKPVALLIKMLKPELVVYRFEKDGKQFRLSKQQCDDFNIPVSDKHLISKEDERQQPQEFLRAGTLGVYRSEEAEKLGLINRVYANKIEISTKVGVHLGSNPLPEHPKAAVIEISGDAGNGTFEMAQDKIRRAIKEEVNCIIFHLINMNGGPETVASATQLANDLLEKTRGERRIKTVAYIPENCTGTANFIALACDEIVMGPDAKIGDVNNLVYQAPNQPFDATLINERQQSLINISQKSGVSETIVRGMFQLNQELVQVQEVPDPNKTDQNLAVQIKDKSELRPGWVELSVMKKKGQLLVLTAAQAVEVGLARTVIQTKDLGAMQSINEVFRLYGISAGDVIIMRASWLDNLVLFLQHPATTTVLAIIAFLGLILEMKAPGTTVPIIVSAICFLLLFWAHSWLSGQVNALAILLFLLGIVLLAVEIFVLPGFGVTGVSGIILMLLGLSLVVVKQWPQTSEEYMVLGRNFGIFSGGLLFSILGAFAVARFLPSLPMFHWLMLQPPDEETSDAGGGLPPASSPSLLGAVGTTVTELRPVGRACFGDDYIDVTTESGFVDAGKRVQIIEIDGLKVIVKPV